MNKFGDRKNYNELWQILRRYLQRLFRRWYVPAGLLLCAFALTIPFTRAVKSFAIGGQKSLSSLSGISQSRLDTSRDKTFLAKYINEIQGQNVAVPSNTTPAVQAIFFYSPTCGHCHLVLNDVLVPMQEEWGEQLQILAIDTSTAAGGQLFGAAITHYEIPAERQGVPMLLVGDLILVGSGEIPHQFPAFAEDALAAGGIFLSDIPGGDTLFGDLLEQPTAPDGAPASKTTNDPTNDPTSEPVTSRVQEEPAVEEASGEEILEEAETTVYLTYFYDPTCLECARVSDDLAELEAQYPNLIVDKFNLRDEALLNEAMSEKFQVAEEYRLLAPAIFIGKEFLPPNEISLARLQTLIGNPSAAAAIAPWAGLEGAQNAANTAIVARFQQFGILAVVGAGLLDGVNPCAFTTIIFFVSYLALVGRKGREILYVGMAFTMAVFLTYLALGFGLLEVLQRVGAFTLIGQIIYGTTALICLVLAWLSLRDYLKIRRGELTDIALQLPKQLKRRIHATIRTRSRMRGYISAAFIAGVLVSIFELACTGQVYLPTIIFVMGIVDERLRALGLLALYNLMFIVPLVAVFLLTYWGTTNRQLTDWFQTHAGTVKLWTAGLFGVMGIWLGYMVL